MKLRALINLLHEHQQHCGPEIEVIFNEDPDVKVNIEHDRGYNPETGENDIPALYFNLTPEDRKRGERK